MQFELEYVLQENSISGFLNISHSRKSRPTFFVAQESNLHPW